MARVLQNMQDGLRGACELPGVSAAVEATLAGAAVGLVYSVCTSKRTAFAPRLSTIVKGAALGLVASYAALHILKPSLHPELIANPNPSLLPHGGT